MHGVCRFSYVAYRADSFEGGLKRGTIAPLFRVEVQGPISSHA